jgi:superfamily II helicase
MGKTDDILFDYTENFLTVDQLADKYIINPKSIREVLREKKVLRHRGKFIKGIGTMRVCIKCGIEKSLDDFHNDRTKAQGKRYICKECVKTK